MRILAAFALLRQGRSRWWVVDGDANFQRRSKSWRWYLWLVLGATRFGKRSQPTFSSPRHAHFAAPLRHDLPALDVPHA